LLIPLPPPTLTLLLLDNKDAFVAVWEDVGSNGGGEEEIVLEDADPRRLGELGGLLLEGDTSLLGDLFVCLLLLLVVAVAVCCVGCCVRLL
jgi:hypothetical protein